MHIKNSTIVVLNQQQWIKRNKGKVVFKMKRYSYINHTPYYLKPKRPKTPTPVFITDEIKNLEMALKTLQLPTKTVLFYPPPHYKSIWQNRKSNLQYWKEIIVKFIKQKHNTDTNQ